MAIEKLFGSLRDDEELEKRIKDRRKVIEKEFSERKERFSLIK